MPPRPFPLRAADPSVATLIWLPGYDDRLIIQRQTDGNQRNMVNQSRHPVI
jgi:hypothetical protein